jgi:hypothetical protein
LRLALVFHWLRLHRSVVRESVFLGLLIGLPPLVHFLLLDARLELVFVLESLALHLLLARGWLLVRVASLLAHLFLELQLLLLGLQVELRLVLSLALVHFDIELLGLPALFLRDLSLLDFKLSKDISLRRDLTCSFPLTPAA